MANYAEGTGLQITATFRTIPGVITDPTAVNFKYENPDGTKTTLVYGTDSALVKESTGVYHVMLLLDTSGAWNYRWIGTGAVAIGYDGTINVPASPLG